MSDVFDPRGEGWTDRQRSAEPERLKDAPRRFYETATVAAAPAGFAVRLDGRPVRTPGRGLLTAPTREIASGIAAEWDAQGERIDPTTMPLTRLANTAIDGVADRMDEVRADVVRYAGSDLLCYRAERPHGLVEREATAWDPLLTWAAKDLRANFVLGQGIVHVAQPSEALTRFANAVATVDTPFRVTGLHVMTALTGSAIVALAVTLGELDVDSAWSAAHVEENWNIHQWGADEEAAARRATREVDMRAAALFALG